MANLINYINGLRTSFFTNQYPSKSELDILLGYGISTSIIWDDMNNKYNKRGDVTVNLSSGNVVEYTGSLSSSNGWSRDFNNIPYKEYTPSLTNFSNSQYYTSTISVNGNSIIFNEVLKKGTILLRFEILFVTGEEDISTIFHSSYLNNTPIELSTLCSFDSFPYTDYDNYTITLIEDNYFLLEYTFNNRIIGTYNSYLNEVYPITDNNNNELIFYNDEGASYYSTGTLTDNGVLTLSNGIFYVDDIEDEFMDIPVTIIWDDNDNIDLNRPSSVTVYLYLNGALNETIEIASAMGWTNTFIDKPIYDDQENEILYTINIDPVEDYITSIDGFTITQTYSPTLVSKTIQIAWDDNDNSYSSRPSSLNIPLSNGTSNVATTTLNEANGWTGTVSNLSTKYNHTDITYTWNIPSISEYTYSTTITGDATRVTYTIYPVPPGVKPPK